MNKLHPGHLVLLALLAGLTYLWLASRRASEHVARDPSVVSAPGTMQSDPLAAPRPAVGARVSATPAAGAVEPTGAVSRATPEPDNEVGDVPTAVGCTVRGLVIDQDDEPVASCTIWICSAREKAPVYLQFYLRERPTTQTVVTDEVGRFLFENVSPGTWWLGPAPDEEQDTRQENPVAPLAQVVEIVEGQPDIELILRVDRGLFIRGRVVGTSGEAPEHAFVVAREPERNLSCSVDVQDGKGSFVLGPMTDTLYVVTASGSGGDTDSEPVVVRPSGDELVLRLRPGGTLSGRIVDDDGNGVAGWVLCTTHDSPTDTQRTTVLDDGLFSFEGLPPGVYDIAGEAYEGGLIGFIQPVEVRGGEAVTDLLVRVSPGGRVRVQHDGPEKGLWICVTQRGIVVDVEGVQPGSSDEVTAPVGVVVMRMEYGEGGRVVERTVEVKAGETVDIVLEAGAR